VLAHSSGELSRLMKLRGKRWDAVEDAVGSAAQDRAGRVESQANIGGEKGEHARVTQQQLSDRAGGQWCLTCCWMQSITSMM
jgi:hypothetical protein